MRLPLRPRCWVPAKAQKNKAVSDEQRVLQRVLVRAILTCERTYYPMFERDPPGLGMRCKAARYARPRICGFRYNGAVGAVGVAPLSLR